MALKQISSNKCFEGFQKVYEHDSVELKCKMKFGIYLPPKAETERCPVLYWLSGLTCTEQNFITKAGYHQAAAEHGLIVVAPDTSPRGCNIKGEDDSWDFGTGAGFYVNATEEPWKTNYRMYSYVIDELPKLINANFPADPKKISIFGHSMGGHGALICALKNPGKYKMVTLSPLCSAHYMMENNVQWGVAKEIVNVVLGSNNILDHVELAASGLKIIGFSCTPNLHAVYQNIEWAALALEALTVKAKDTSRKLFTNLFMTFAPICNPVLCPWGKKAFGGYLGSDQSKWEAYDATQLVKSYPDSQLDILIDQGKDDQFLKDGQLLPDNFIAACAERKIPVVFRLQEGYDHNYYFIATFINDHIRHHAKYLNA